jgi:hypothetical protein
MIMRMILGIINLVAGFCCLNCAFSIRYGKSLKNNIIIWTMVILGSLNFGLAFVQFIRHSNKPKQYPASEYHLSIKTTTIDNQTDTTYVITKIK